ncbi:MULTISPECIES: lipase family protein [Streptomyces]|uniref:Alpha/beta fold hydrolase n=1 Tax=Streptomyces thermoviolaceus subsp. thermoviolaceus TaxID=66860 RepID=A0ABX0YM68_STRTL|nr:MULTISPECIES: lipase family protein [Streptomyces]WTD46214.1 lipase family protein [Streptomyces thermoviolaceus]NJP13632.1 alpha/beta fold hydrolase [Streptomyces thermoviolaceus subsp. thermoviolaceus]RSS03623.1 alpha/beta fold hydrolase [Streptomyces sp. WAC00469]GGV65638.1 triacylglycerol lipase [Streptomyces thermoviolaceus subsp. apingens]GHA75415.1 triacylglycerol lipase [Streptomyces thermoviolaceus subsp. thermoviolaceus]
MPVRRRLLAAALTALSCLGVQALAATAAEASTASASVVSRGVTIPEFYDPPAELPAADGTLIRSEPLRLALWLPSLHGPLPGRATRLMYKSTDANGEPVAVTGAYIEPTARWKGSGPRPLVVVAPGTMGQGDQCAASLGLEHPITLNGKTVSVGYEDLSIYRLLARGTAVVVTDYVGLGATDRLHTYVNRVDEAHAVLDAARAARSVEGASVTADSPVGLFGYSQGGGATAAAAELQPQYAPDVRLAGTYAGAPPADLTKVTEGIDGTELTGALGWSLNGFLQSDPELRPIAEAHLNAAGKDALADLSTMCVGDAILRYGYAKSSKWTTDGQTLSEIIGSTPQLQEFLDTQRIGRLRPAGPVRVATGTQDDLVPHGQARQLAVDWCAQGADVVYEPVVLPDVISPLLNHFGPLLTDQGAAVDWLTDRLAGKPAASTCATLPSRP